MYTIEKREEIGKVLRGKFQHVDPIPWTRIAKDIKDETDIRIPLETMRRVFNGGYFDGEDVPQKAHKQDVVISLLAKHLNLDMRPFRPSFDVAPEMYFPASYAFKPYNRTWIADCFDVGALKHLQNACIAAGTNNVPTDGFDKKRLKIVARHKTQLECMRMEAVTKKAQPSLPLQPAANPPEPDASRSTRHIEMAPSGTGFSLDVSRSLVKQLEQQGLPTGEIKAAIVARLQSDKDAMARLISSALGF